MDLLANKENIKVEVYNEEKIIYNFINENNLDMKKIFGYPNKTQNMKAVMKLYELGGKDVG